MHNIRYSKALGRNPYIRGELQLRHCAKGGYSLNEGSYKLGGCIVEIDERLIVESDNVLPTMDSGFNGVGNKNTLN